MNKTEIFNLIKTVKGYEKSLKHDSLDKNKKSVDKPFQKYEFLGDRVLGLIISEYLIENFHKSSLDEISRRFIHLVNTNTLAKIFKYHEFNEILIVANDPIKHLKSNKIRKIKDFKKDLGPLGGIFTAMKWAKDKNKSYKWIASFPSDTPFFKKNILNNFFEKVNEIESELFFMTFNDKRHYLFG